MSNIKEITTARFSLSLVLLIVLSTLIRLFHYPGQMAFDEQIWISTGQALLGWKVPAFPPEFSCRTFWSLLLAGWGLLFGWSWLSFRFFALILSAGTILAVGFAARTLFGSRVGILSSIFFALHPINIIYDVTVLADTLAVFLIAIALVFFSHYLCNFRIKNLAFAGILAGFLISVKNYYILYTIPFGLTVLIFRTGRQQIYELMVLSIATLAGLSLAFSLAFITGHGLAFYYGYSSYIEHHTENLDVVHLSLRQWINLFLGPIQFYFNGLFNEHGQIFGLLILWTVVVLIREVRRLPQAFLLITVVFLLLFLMFMPISLHPIAFIEYQTRYLTIVLVPLSIGAGYALDHLASALQSRRLAVPGLLVFVLAIGIAIAEPNIHWDRYHLLEISGVRKALDLGRQNNISVIAIPEDLKLGISESLLRSNIEVISLPMQGPDGADVLGFLEGDPAKRAVFIPREHYRILAEDLRIGSLRDHEVAPALAKTVSTLEKAGAARVAVVVPFTSLKARLADLGIETQGQLVGWLYRVPTATATGVNHHPHDNEEAAANSHQDKDVNLPIAR